MDSGLIAREYTEHLTDADVRLLLSAEQADADSSPGSEAGQTPGRGRSWLLGDPDALQALLGDPRVFSAVLGTETGTPGHASSASPFLVFAVIVHRSATELGRMAHVPERTGPRQRVPLFDAPELRDFLGSPARRLFLTELLASFTRVASGRYPVRGRGASRTQRFSELDPVRLAGLLVNVPDSERPGIYRRLGDVALFLTGVFPDYATGHAFGPVDVARLLRSARLARDERDALTAAPAIDLLEYLGARWYRAAWEWAPVRTARLSVIADIADRFRQARRVLNHVADGYLFPSANPWLPRPAL
jgi:hypothetical protein